MRGQVTGQVIGQYKAITRSDARNARDFLRSSPLIYKEKIKNRWDPHRDPSSRGVDHDGLQNNYSRKRQNQSEGLPVPLYPHQDLTSVRSNELVRPRLSHASTSYRLKF